MSIAELTHMKKKVVYVSYMVLTDRVSRDWLIDFLISKDIDVEYWDVSPLLRGVIAEFGAKKTAYLRTFGTYEEVAAALSLPENKHALYVIVVNYCGRYADLFRLLSKFNCKMLQMTWAALPLNIAPKHQKVKTELRNPVQLAIKIFHKAKEVAYKKIGLVKPFEIVFAGGKVLSNLPHYAKRIVSVNNNDYDLFRTERARNERIVEGAYVVFLDNNLPFHADVKLMGALPLEPKQYFASLNAFFTLLERKLGIKIVIAAHPTANYGIDVFQGREIHRGSTARLVKHSEFTIAHHSTSLSYSVLSKKPIVFIFTSQMKCLYESSIVSFIFDIAKYLNCRVYNIDEISDQGQIDMPHVDSARYESYRYDFLTTPESEGRATKDVVLAELERAWSSAR